MMVEGKLPGWGFWGRWAVASAAGYGFSAFLGMCVAWAVVGVEDQGTTRAYETVEIPPFGENRIC